MATRRERVILDLEDNFSGPMARAAASAALLNRELNNSNRNVDKSSKSTDRLGSSVSSLGEEARTASKDMDRLSERSVTSLGRSAERQGKQIDKLSGRLALFAQAAAVLGPALVPLGAAAIPALSGMALQLGLVAAAGGTAMLAFHGLGDSLTALDKAKLDPSAANLAKLRQELDKLGPAGQDFVFFLDDLEGKMKGLRSVAQQGLLPGVQEGITALLTRLPQVREIMFSLASTMGDLAKNAGESLAGPKFTEFFNYLQTTARPVLTELGQTLGNVFKGFADMLVGFDPLSRSFSSGMLAMSQSFAKWADGLSATTGFQDFVSYIQTNGPRALEAIGAIGNALVQLVSAAAPVGAAVLPVITSLANAFSAMADSSVGPALIATAAAVSVLSRSMALLGVNAKGITSGGLMGTKFAAPFKALPAVLGEARASVAALATAEREASLAHSRYIGSLRASSTQLSLLGRPGKGAASSADALVAANNKQAAAAKRAAEAEQAKAKAIEGGRSAAVRGAAAAAGLVVATSGLADKTGLANTASLGLMGTLAGPYGAAIGASVGALQDAASANNDVVTSVEAANRALNSQPAAFQANTAAIRATMENLDAFKVKVGESGSVLQRFFHGITPGGIKNWTESVFGKSDVEETTDRIHKLAQESLRFGTTMSEVGVKLGGKNMIGATGAQLEALATHITPALDKAGISVKSFLDSASNSNVRLDGLKAIKSYFDDLSSASGRSKAVGAAIAALGDAASSSVPPVDALKSSLDNLFGIQMSQGEAADNAVRALRAMRKALDDTKGGINSNSKSALDARDATRAYVNSQLQLVEANAAVDHNGRRAAQTLLATRDGVIAAARAAGASKPAIAAYVRQLGLTPRNLTTIIQTSGTLSATQKVRALAKLYGVTPRQVKTMVSQAGAEPSAAKIRALAKLYHLTPKQVRTLISAQDAASAKAAAAKKHLQEVKDRRVAIQVASNAAGAAGAARAALNSVQSRTVTLTVRTQHITTNQAITIPGITKPRGISENGNLYVGAKPMAFADGGFGTDGRYYAREPQMLKGGANVLWGEKATGWEAYISGKPAQKDRNLDIWRQAGERLGARFVEYANGGLPGHKPGPRQQFDLFGGMSMAGVRREFKQFEKAMGGASKRLNGLEGMALRVAHAYNLEERQLKRVQAKSRDLSNSTQSALTHDPFGNGLTGLGDVLQQDKMNSLHMASSLKKLKRKGISRGLEAALAASGDSATAMELAKLSRSQINKYDTLYSQRNRAADYAGDVASRNVYGGQIRHLNRTLNHLDKRLSGIEKAAERGTARGTAKGMTAKGRASARNRRVRR